MIHPASVHTYPSALPEHDTTGLDCWCSPVFSAKCSCDGQCWQCERGWVELTREQAEHCDAPMSIVHHRDWDAII